MLFFLLRKLTFSLNSINGDNSSGALMQVIRYCVPFDDHELKKLVYVHPLFCRSLAFGLTTVSFSYAPL